jgi:Tfp pilus assembly protein PilO
MKMSLRSQRSAAIVIVLSAVGAVAYVVWGFLPQRAVVAELRRQIEEKQLVADSGQRTAEQISQTTEELLEARRYAEAWRDDAPSQESLIALFRDINQLSQNAGARNLRLEPGPVESLAAVWRAPVSLSAEGKFLQLFELVRGVEMLSPNANLTSVEIDSASGAPQSLRMRATLTIFGAKPGFSGYANLTD